MKKNLFILSAGIIISVLCAKTHAQTVTTVAGNGSTMYSGDGGAATAASIYYPYGMVKDRSGNIFITDVNHRIRKVSPTGIITTYAGTGVTGLSGDGGPASAAKLFGPTGIAIDGAGNLYIADQDNQRIRKINTAGIISTVAGSGPSGLSGGGYSGDGGPATLARLNYPTAVAVDAAGNIYIADQYNNRVRKVSASGIITTIAGTGISGFVGDGGPGTLARVNAPDGVAASASGNVYVADYNNRRVRRIDPSGMITTIAGTGVAGFSGDGLPSTAAQLYNPFGVATDAIGNIYIADMANHRIRKINASGIISTIAGTGLSGFSGDGGPATAAALYNPAGMFVDCAGNLYFGDQLNNRVRMITSGSDIDCSLAADLTAPASGDVVIYPNPVSNELTISIADGSYSSYSVFNATGQLLLQQPINTTFTTVDVKMLSAGLYYISLKGTGGNVVKKFVKE